MRVTLPVLFVLASNVISAAQIFEDRGVFLVDPAVEPRDPVAIAVGDFDGDSAPDVGAALRYKDFSVFLQGPSRDAWTRRDLETPDHDFDYAKAHAVDVDADGIDDLVCFIPPGMPRVLFGSRTGDFVLGPTTALPDPPWELSLGELAGGGPPDLLAHRPSYSDTPSVLQIFPGSPDGSYGDPIAVTVSNPAAANAVYLLAEAGRLDLDDQGDIVLALVPDGSTTLVLLLQEDGVFHEAWSTVVPLPVAALRIVDLDGDGELDVAAAFHEPAVSTWGGATIVLYRAIGSGSLEEMARWTHGGTIHAIDAADLDGDGLPEFVAQSEAGRLSTWRQTSPWTFSFAQQVLGGSGGFVLEDLDGDGHRDAIVGAGLTDSFPGPLLLRGKGDGGFAAAPAVREILDGAYPALGDADGDGFPDLLYGMFDYSTDVGVEFLKGDGSGGFALPVASRHEVTRGMLESDFRLGDVNGDGRLDAVFATQDLASKRRILVFHGNGDGAFDFPIESEVAARLIDLRDLDGDGRAEVLALVGFYEGLEQPLPRVVIVRESLAGVLEETASLGGGLAVRAFGSADLDGDGCVDVIVSGSMEPASGIVQPIVFLGQGDGTFLPPVASEISPPLGYTRIPLGDWNGDGILDLVLAEGYSPGRGDGSFGPLEGPAIHESVLSSAIADLNLDGRDDVALPANNVRAILAPGTDPANESFTLGGLQADHVLTADLDLDGDPDLVSSGRVVAVYRNESVRTEKSFIRGDANADSGIDIADPIWMLNYLFRSGPPPLCLDSADMNDDGKIDISDAVRSLLFLFQAGAPAPEPFPSCGRDPTPDALGCDDYQPCE